MLDRKEPSIRLIPMTDFVIKECGKCGSEPRLQRIEKYALFLKQPLTLDMFVPCDDKGNIVYEPAHPDYECFEKYKLDCRKYEEAKEKVLFEGFKVNCYTDENGDFHEYVNGYFKRTNNGKWISDNTQTAERLCNSFSGKLTQSAIKQFYEIP